MSDFREKIYEYYVSARLRKSFPEEIVHLKTREPYFLKLISCHLPKNKNINILEIGCGHGAFLHYLNKAEYYNCVGIDISKEQVESAKKMGIKGVFQVDILTYLKKCEDNSIDVLVALDVFEHFSKAELDELIELIYPKIRKNGMIICHGPNANSPFGMTIRYGDFTHSLAFTEDSIAQIFLSNGFTSVKSYEDKPIPHGFKSAIRWFLWTYVVRNIYRFLTAIETGESRKDMIFSRNFITIIRK
jgi:2-polyprenyl-3-methyl-5-hydroxy-6-metoxy-1,4-benzoquinol methylase